MSLSFTFRSTPTQPTAGKRRVLVTGAAGNIGGYFSHAAKDRYSLRLLVLPGDKNRQTIEDCGEVVEADLADLPALKQACKGIDTVLHLAGSPDPQAAWQDLLSNNIVGTYHMMAAARSAGCRRLIYASSIHAVSGYPNDVQVKTTEPVNPGDLYGVTKCFGEAMGRYMAEQEDLSVIALRIGAAQPTENTQSDDALGMTDMFIAYPDLQQLIEKCIDDERLQWALFNGVSDNRVKRLDVTDARELLGYAPQHDILEMNPKLKALDLRRRILGGNMKDPKQQSGMRDQIS